MHPPAAPEAPTEPELFDGAATVLERDSSELSEPASVVELRDGRASSGPHVVGPPGLARSDAAGQRQVAALRAEADALSAELQSTQRDLDRQRRATRSAREEAKKLRNELRSQRDQMEALRVELEGGDLFADPLEQLKHDVAMAWLRRTPDGRERQRWPLREWTVGPRFLPSLAELEGISRAKVLDVLVEVITDRVKLLPGRDLHPLRDGRSGRQRARDGAQAWRCALQVKTPGARRLHFWILPGNRVELDQVGVHDDGIVM